MDAKSAAVTILSSREPGPLRPELKTLNLGPLPAYLFCMIRSDALGDRLHSSVPLGRIFAGVVGLLLGGLTPASSV